MTAIHSGLKMLTEGHIRRACRLAHLRMSNRRPSYYYSCDVTDDSPSRLRELYISQSHSFAHSATPPSVTTLLSTNRPDRVVPTLRMLARQIGVQLNVVVATHGFSAKEYMSSQIARDLSVTWLSPSKDLTLGQIYNQILDYADTDFVAKIDDDDWYGDEYLISSIAAITTSGADITGKNAIFVYSQAHDQVFIRMPHKHHRFVFSVAGGTIVARTDIAQRTGFRPLTLGEDQDFLTRAFDSGARIYSSSPFGYVYRRGSHNTWNPENDAFLTGATLIHGGLPGAYECVRDEDAPYA